MMVLHLVLARLLPKNTKRFGIGASTVHMNSEAPPCPLLHFDFIFGFFFLVFVFFSKFILEI
jgi:hypothetical protein